MDPVLLSFLKVLFLLPIFLLLSIFVFYIPGLLIIKKIDKNLRDDERIVLSLGLGFILFLLVAILVSLLKIRFISPFLFLLINLYAFIKYKKGVLLPFFKLVIQRWLMAFLLLGTLVEGFINFPSSFPFKDGHLYWSSQGHDGLWHVSVIEEIKTNFPPNNPLYAGEKLYNYHYFSDVVVGEFNRIFPFFSSLDLYFRFFSFLIAFLMGLAAYSFLTTWTKNKIIGYLGIFFTYLVGSFGYMVLVIQGRGFFGGETIFWAAQGNTIIGNPPHAFCYVLVPAFLLALYYFLKEKSLWFFFICFLLSGFLAGFKVSAGVVVLAGLLAASLFSLVLKKNREIILLTGLAGLTNFLTLKSITKDVESFLIFQPWWFIRTMIVAPDRVNWLDLELRRQFYLAKGGFRATLRIIQFETTAFFLFLIGNLGMRVIGFWEIGKGFWRKTIFKDPVFSTIFFAMLTAFLIPLFFIQKGVVYNLIQFMQYFLLLFGFSAAISLYNFINLFKNKIIKIIIFIFIFILSIPTVIGNLYEFYGKNALAVISNQELEALNFLKKQSADQDIILTKPFNPYARGLYKHQPWPIYAWDSTGYVSAYTDRQTYYTDEGQMKILGIKGTDERLALMRDFFDTELSFEKKEKLFKAGEIDLEKKKEFLEKENISFIYLRQEETDDVQKEIFSNLGLKEIFKNGEAEIFRLD